MDEIQEENDRRLTDDLDKSWLSSLRKRVEETKWKQWRTEPPTIFSVPKNIREVDPKAYEPRILSLGPFHHGKKRLRSMEELKWHYLKSFLSRNPDKSLEDYLRKMKESEIRARSAYSVEFGNIKSNKFVEIMLLDGCFVLELFLMRTEGRNRIKEIEEDPLVGTRWVLPLVTMDMLMLENQLPFFILEDLFGIVSSGKRGNSLAETAISCLDDDLLQKSIKLPSMIPKIHHLLHLYHCAIIPDEVQKDEHKIVVQSYLHYKLLSMKSLSSKVRGSLLSSTKKLCFWSDESTRRQLEPSPESIPCATRLKEFGVKFKRKKEAKSFLDASFSSGLMEIPQLAIYDSTNCLLRNIIAFEQCFPGAGNYVTTYATFMDCIIDTPTDVGLLQRDGIIVNGLGSDGDVVALFNRLCREVIVDPENWYVAKLFRDIDEHCNSKWNKWRAKLNRDYFSNPWSIISFLAGLLLISLSITQGTFAILRYVRPPS